MTAGSTPDALQRERDLYAHLLRLGSEDEVEGVLDQALEVAVHAVGAAKGYLAIFAPDHRPGRAPRWWRAFGCSQADVDSIQAEFSSTIIWDALETRRVQVIPSAMGHPKFMHADSVRINRITSVVCAPVGGDGLGVLYLQDRVGGGIFEQEHEQYVLRFGQLIGPSIDRVVRRDRATSEGDPTAIWRRGGRFSRWLGRSPRVAELLRVATRQLTTDGPILLVGPSGAGKHLLARELHACGEQPLGPFVRVSRGEVTRGALLGEDDGRNGLLEAARDGTLFLHHVETLSEDAQEVLVELLAEGGYRAPGHSALTPLPLRVVASTGDGLAEAVAAGAFRRDLFDLLDAGRIEVPGLRERTEDLPLLVEALAQDVAARQQLPWLGLAPGARQALVDLPWSGHVRELIALLRRAIVAADGRRQVTADDLAPSLELGVRPPPDLVMDGPTLPWRDALMAFKQAYLQRVLRANGGNATATARALGLSRSRIFALMHELDLRDDSE